MSSLLLIFVDGLGLGLDDPAVNPVVSARMPVLRGLLGGRAPVARAAPFSTSDASLVGLDALLDVPGLPQSGTGQATLLTGENAARLFGRHFGPWTPTALRPMVERRSILARAVEAGRRVAFANAYPEEVVGKPGPAGPAAGPPILRPIRGSGARHAAVYSPLFAGPPLAARAAGLLTRHTPELARGEAVASELVNEGWRERLGRHDLPEIDAAEAGRNLAAIAAQHELTLFAHYATDYVGHRGSYQDAVAALERLDAFLGGLLERLPSDTVLIVASDHGNIEDVRAGHTYNPALGLVVGPGHAGIAAGLRSLMDVAPTILTHVGVPEGDVVTSEPAA